MYKIKLNLKKIKTTNGYPFTHLLHVKVMDKNGKYIKFAEQTPQLIDWINSQELILDTESIIKIEK